MLLNNRLITEEIKEENKQTNKQTTKDSENETTVVQKLWDVSKPVLEGKFIVIQPYLKKQEKSQTI